MGMILHHNSLWKPPLGAELDKSHPLARGLVADWLLNEGGGSRVNDLSGNGNHGTITGATWAGGEFGPCLSFNGSSSLVNCGSNASIDLTVGFTLSFLYYQATANTNAYVVAKRSLGAGNIGYNIYFGAANAIVLFDGLTASHAVGTAVTGRWSMVSVVVTQDGTGFTPYIDGIAGTPVSGMSPLTGNGIDLLFGNRTGGTAWYNGLLDLMTIYNRALTAGEIAQLYRELFAMYRSSRLELWTAALGGAPPSFKPAWAARRRQLIGGGII